MAAIQIVTLLPRVLEHARECPTVIALQHYLDAARRFCNEARWLQRNVPFSTVDGHRIYELDVDDAAVEIIGINQAAIKVGGRWRPLTEGYSGGWDPNDPEQAPTRYQYIPHGGIALHRLPDAAYEVLVTTVVQPARDATTLPSELLVDWEDALRDGALGTLLALRRTPWEDPKEATRRADAASAAINSARLSAARGFNAGAAPTDRPGGGNAMIRTRVLPI
ncbi:hypothetical protein [Piscinibacter sakaiensis]|uniref:Uncharacterized protein n=1 Tax=Piscinibacter sakaiensis TaxID=1547922 RepID=A0A0K8P410_PISS1|nr:hypothetical protein [Piscinibacter sakaiensis]GAP37388.1 hypothetical protein ISF6_3243 [Piscinibacter sakaiensis]